MKLDLLEKFCDKRDIAVNTFQKAAELLNNPDFISMGFRMKGIAIHSPKGNHNMIVYDENLSAEEQYFVFAHEIAHHVLEHMTNRDSKRDSAEIEADVFASVLMALNVYEEMKGATV